MLYGNRRHGTEAVANARASGENLLKTGIIQDSLRIIVAPKASPSAEAWQRSIDLPADQSPTQTGTAFDRRLAGAAVYTHKGVPNALKVMHPTFRIRAKSNRDRGEDQPQLQLCQDALDILAFSQGCRLVQ
jgi:hypothetical protein